MTISIVGHWFPLCCRSMYHHSSMTYAKGIYLLFSYLPPTLLNSLLFYSKGVISAGIPLLVSIGAQCHYYISFIDQEDILLNQASVQQEIFYQKQHYRHPDILLTIYQIEGVIGIPLRYWQCLLFPLCTIKLVSSSLTLAPLPVNIPYLILSYQVGYSLDYWAYRWPWWLYLVYWFRVGLLIISFSLSIAIPSAKYK